MPRNASGTYSLPSGNPVSSGTLIDSNWANNTLNDLANEVTDSLSRSAEGGMLAPLRLTDGVQATPSLAFTNEPSTGLYRAGTNEAWFVTGGNQVAKFTSTGMEGRFAAGAAATPSLAAYNDVNTGLWFPAADTIAASTGGSERLRVDSGGNLGIGTSSPGARLDVVTGTARWRISNDGSGNIIDEVLDSTGAAYRDYKLYGLNLISYTSGSERMRLDSSGNLGIGTSSPKAKLQSTGAAATATPTGGSATGSAQYLTNTNDAFGMLFGISGGGAGWIQQQRTDATNTQYDLLINPIGGNVGIGTSSPAQRLDVTGALNSVQARFGNVAGRGLEISTELVGGTNDAGATLNAPVAGGTLIFKTVNSERARIDSSGNLGIGTASPTTRLQVDGAIRSNTSITGPLGFFFTSATNPASSGASGNGLNLGYDNNGEVAWIQANRNSISETRPLLINPNGGSVAAGTPSLATNATNGFLYVPTCAGTPTGTPTAITGMAPIVVNTTNNKLYFYSGGAWRDAGP
jgi:hypothetical protein